MGGGFMAVDPDKLNAFMGKADVVMKGGFTRFRRASQTPFNLVLEARP
jgi:hypothetical protein